MAHENAEDLTANVFVGRSVKHRSTIGFARHRSYGRTATVDKIAQPMEPILGAVSARLRKNNRRNACYSILGNSIRSRLNFVPLRFLLPKRCSDATDVFFYIEEIANWYEMFGSDRKTTFYGGGQSGLDSNSRNWATDEYVGHRKTLC